MAEQLLSLASAPVPQQKPVPREPVRLTPEFERFGTWGEEVGVVRDGAIWKLARWIALNGEPGLDEETLWQRCRDANPQFFRTYRTVNLDAPSFFLPRGEVVFRVVVEPSQLPDNPPEGVLMRHIEAMEAFPQATTYLLQPVFMSDSSVRLFSAGELRLEAEGDRREVLAIARRFGWAFRAIAAARRKVRDACLFLLRIVTQELERLAPPPTRRQRFDWNEAGYWRARQTLTAMSQRAEEQGLLEEVVRFREALGRLAEIDPVLCFELPDKPGELWFESHWFQGIDGKRYVHY